MSIAIPLAGLTVLATLLGGQIGLRFSDRLETLLALTGGVVVAIALFDVLPEGIDGVGDVNVFGARDYAMRIWIDPKRLANFELSAQDVIQAIQSQNVQAAAGRVSRLRPRRAPAGPP